MDQTLTLNVLLEAVNDSGLMVGGPGAQGFGVWGWVVYFSSLFSKITVAWPWYYFSVIFFWPIYVLQYYVGKGANALLGIDTAYALWFYLLFRPDFYAPIFYFDVFYPEVEEEAEAE